MAKVLNDGGLTCFKISEAAGYLHNLSFDAILSGLKSRQMLKYQIVYRVVHFLLQRQVTKSRLLLISIGSG